MSGFGDIMAASAAASSSQAATAAREAASASEERLEGGKSNPFLVFKSREFDTVPGESFWSFFGVGSKVKLQETYSRVSVKRTDIAHLVPGTDDFGNKYTKIYLEERCNLDEYIYVEGDIEEISNYINSK